MPLYVLREGLSNAFKIGSTSFEDVNRRRQQLNSASTVGLRTFEVIHIDCAEAAEAFFHKMLAHRKVARHGGSEFFEMHSEQHMRAFIEEAVPLFSRHQATVAGPGSLDQTRSSRLMLAPEEADRAVLKDLREKTGPPVRT